MTPRNAGFFARLFGKKPAPAAPPSEPSIALSEENSIYIDKTWHALHFLFTGSDWKGDFPHGFLLSCGKPVGDVDVGYGPAKSFTSSEVGQIAEFLASLNREELRNRFDPAKMHDMDIYPSIWDSIENIDDEWEYICWGLDEIIRFVGEAAERNMALLVYIN